MLFSTIVSSALTFAGVSQAAPTDLAVSVRLTTENTSSPNTMFSFNPFPFAAGTIPAQPPYYQFRIWIRGNSCELDKCYSVNYI
ncbi:hypothetical protein DFH09DRAFT_1325181 [Mycena vulgaris]|nr:hypothetical protein DFH09DRAFT_1325181 [Mycena vulgaris]